MGKLVSGDVVRVVLAALAKPLSPANSLLGDLLLLMMFLAVVVKFDVGGCYKCFVW